MIIICLIAGFCFWYLWYGLECAMNGATGGLSMPFLCLWKDIQWTFYPPSKAAYIKQLMGDFEDGIIGDWRYSEIRQKNLYRLVASKVLPGPIHFVFTHLFIPFGPAILWSLSHRLS